MTPCKFQMDATGESIFIYSEDRETVHAQSFDPEFVGIISEALGMMPLTKKYAMAEINDAGEIAIGDELSPQPF